MSCGDIPYNDFGDCCGGDFNRGGKILFMECIICGERMTVDEFSMGHTCKFNQYNNSNKQFFEEAAKKVAEQIRKDLSEAGQEATNRFADENDIHFLSLEMDRYSRQGNYEQAAIIRDQILDKISIDHIL